MGRFKTTRAATPSSGTSGLPGPRRGPGILYLVATPIGNLEDVTLRAIRVLGEVDWIAAEDTRRTSILLREHGIVKPLLTYHAHNEHAKVPLLVERLITGETGALVTDAGTPGVSDPGFLLAREARAAGISIQVLPGPSAVMAALLLSGFPCEAFCFLGYPPPKGAARRRFVERAASLERTVVLFEAPHRIVRLLEDLVAHDPDRQIALCREMTKKFEEVLRGRSQDLFEELQRRPRKGEYTVVLAAPPPGEDA